VRVYPIQESELHQIGTLNLVSSISLAIGSCLLGFCLSIHWGLVGVTDPVSASVGQTLLWVFWPLSIVAFGVTALLQWGRKTDLDRIKSESNTPEG
jgi:hypothetical protein